jgi:aspartokinase-like uncharacterized kinase
MTSPPSVIKVGGSLFDMADFPAKLDHWLNDQPIGRHVLIPGGGRLADAIRDADDVHQIGDEAGHWLCVQLLDVSAQLLACMIGDARLVRRFGELEAAMEGEISGRWILSVEDFMRQHEPRIAGRPLSHDWRSATDAIGARVACALNAPELVLLKSCDLPLGTDRQAAAAKGLIDQALPEAAQDLTLTWVNLRSDGSRHSF